MKFFCAIVFVCLTQGALSLLSDGTCPTVFPQPDFNNNFVDGIFYDQKNYPWAGGDGLDCIYASYKDIATNLNSAVGGVRTSDQQQVLIPYEGKPVSTGVISFVIENEPIDVLALASDNKSYILFYGCRQKGEQKEEYAWILTRDRNPAQAIIDAAMNNLDFNGLDSSLLIDVNQQNCPPAVAQS